MNTIQFEYKGLQVTIWKTRFLGTTFYSKDKKTWESLEAVKRGAIKQIDEIEYKAERIFGN